MAFPSFPYEWTPDMLAAAARLTLDLAEGLLAEGIGLKDGTPVRHHALRPALRCSA